MPRLVRALLVLAVLAAPAPGAAQEPQPPARPLASASVIAIDSRVLTFVPSRDDLTVGTAVLAVHSDRPAEVRLDGAPLEHAWTTLDLRRVGPNRFALPPVRLEHPPDALVCLSVKVWFAEVGNQFDGLFYEDLDDRYALVAFATRTHGPGWEQARARFSQNRVATLAELVDVLSRPLRIALNARPLSDAR